VSIEDNGYKIYRYVDNQQQLEALGIQTETQTRSGRTRRNLVVLTTDTVRGLIAELESYLNE
jgi:hypothetical protein